MTRIALNPLYHSTLGFDGIFDRLDKMLETSQTPGYPPHNIIKTEDHKYVVELACAGFSKDELDINVEDNIMTVTGEKKDKPDVQFLHHGISTRKFAKQIRLLDTVEVRGAEYRDGILRIGLENVIPENKKPRSVEIGDELKFYNPQLLTEG